MAICFHSPLDTAQSIFYAFGMIIQASEIKSLQSRLIGCKRDKYSLALTWITIFECVKLGKTYINKNLFSKLFACVWFTMCFLVCVAQAKNCSMWNISSRCQQQVLNSVEPIRYIWKLSDVITIINYTFVKANYLADYANTPSRLPKPWMNQRQISDKTTHITPINTEKSTLYGLHWWYEYSTTTAGRQPLKP